MTDHAHAQYVEGCYRCDLSRDEVGGTIVYADWWWICDECGDGCDEPYGSEGAAQQAAAEHECEGDA